MLGFGEDLEERGERVGHVCPCIEVGSNQEADFLIGVGDALGSGGVGGGKCCLHQLTTLLKEETLGAVQVGQTEPINVGDVLLVELQSSGVGGGQSSDGHEVVSFELKSV